MLELLLVIGIIGILIALSVFGFKAIGRVMREKVTRNQLENCKSLLAEYELTSTLDTLPCAIYNTNRWIAPAGSSTSTALNCTIIAQQRFLAVGNAYNPLERYLRDETARVITKLRTTPKNREAIEKISSDRIAQIKYPTVDLSAAPTSPPETLEYANTVVTAQGFNVLDGSGYPIYFVPGGGITGVKAGYHGGDMNNPANYDTVYGSVATPGALRAPDGRPFWVSPGPDNDLTTGDDNIYSFEN